MTILVGRQQMWYAGWVIAALILAAINGTEFLALENHALEGYSPAIRSLQSKLARMENILTVQNAIDSSSKEIQRLFTAYRLQQSLAPAETDVKSSESDTSPTTTDEPNLPALTGIVQITEGGGKTDYIALIEGKVCRSRDYVMEFRVMEISQRGIVLSRSGKRWFIQSPTTYYSSDQGK